MERGWISFPIHPLDQAHLSRVQTTHLDAGTLVPDLLSGFCDTIRKNICTSSLKDVVLFVSVSPIKILKLVDYREIPLWPNYAWASKLKLILLLRALHPSQLHL